MAKSQTKAKTTKLPVAVKAADAATTAITMTQDLRLIPLDQLELSPLNVRKVAASATDDAELLASIRENGIKQNLVVHALADGKFAVDAGGRRLKALKQLANDGIIPNDHPVSCLVEDEQNAIVTSTTENLQRAAMHPADQFEAFAQMIVEGRKEDDIALKFGVSVDLVRRRLKLARIAPELIEQFGARYPQLRLLLENSSLSNKRNRYGNVLHAIEYHRTTQNRTLEARKSPRR